MTEPTTEEPEDSRPAEGKLVQFVTARLTGAEADNFHAILPKLKAEHVAAYIELQKLLSIQQHEERMARIKATAEAEQQRLKLTVESDQQRLKAGAEAEQLRLKNDAELTRAGPRLVLWLILAAFGFILIASAIFLWLQKPDLLPQIITAGLGLVTGLAGGYGIGRATTPTGKT